MQDLLKKGSGFLLLLGLFFQPVAAQQLMPHNQDLFEEAARAYDDERYMVTLGLLEELLETQTSVAESWLLLVSTHVALEDVSSAGETLDRALTHLPDEPRLLQARADLLLCEGEYEWALAREKAGDTKEAIDAYLELIDQGFYHPEMFLKLAEEGEEITGMGQGCQLFEAGLSLVLRQFISQQNIALAEVEKMDQGMEFKKRKPGEVDLIALNRVSDRMMEGVMQTCSREEAELAFGKLIRQYANSGKIHLMVSRYYKEYSRMDLALEHAGMAVELAPNQSEAHGLYAGLLETTGRIEDARVVYEKALTLDIFNNEFYEALLRIHRTTNSLDELCDRWYMRYRVDRQKEVLKEYLTEALMRAGRWEEAQDIRDADN